MKGGITIPNDDFIISILNLSKNDIESFEPVVESYKVNYYITLKIRHIECPYCGGSMFSNGVKVKEIKHPSLRDYDGFIHWRAHRYKCRDCSKTHLEPNPFTFPGFQVSFAVMQRIMNELRNLNYTYKDIALRNCVSVTTVQSYFDSWVHIPRIYLPEWIGMDEIHSDMAKYGSAYLCILTDCTHRGVFEVLPSRSKLTLSKYFESIPLLERNKVRYVTMDMWEPYKAVAYKYFKNCIVAVDPFHVIKHLSTCFTLFRISIMNQVDKDSITYYLLKSWHYLLETDCILDNKPEYNKKLKRSCNRRDLYEMLLTINEDFTLAYQLKESYRKFNAEATPDNAEEWLTILINSFTSSNLHIYFDFISLLNHWKPEIINSFKRPYGSHKLSNAYTENVNGKIRSYLAVSNGTSNFDRFRKKIIYALNDKIFYSLTQTLHSCKRKSKPRGLYNK